MNRKCWRTNAEHARICDFMLEYFQMVTCHNRWRRINGWPMKKHNTLELVSPWTAFIFYLTTFKKILFMNREQILKRKLKSEYKILIKNASRFNGPTKSLIWVVLNFLSVFKAFHIYVSCNIQSCHSNEKSTLQLHKTPQLLKYIRFSST